MEGILTTFGWQMTILYCLDGLSRFHLRPLTVRGMWAHDA